MIAIPAGFSARMDDGVVVISNGATELRYLERLRPVPTIEALWGDALPSSAPPRPFVTHEGEYAWILDGASSDQAFAGCVLGAVIGDDFVAVLETTTTSAGDHARGCALVEELLRGDVHMLCVRRRPYWHDAPEGWNIEIPDPLHVSYRTAGTVIDVSPAIPRTLIQRGPLIDSLEMPAERASSEVQGLLAGTRWSAIRENDRCVEAFVVEDGEYFYPAVGECDIGALPQLVTALETVMRSIEPIPRSRSRGIARSSVGAFRRALIAGL